MKRMRLVSFLVVAILLVAPVSVVVMSDEEQDSEAVFPIGVALMAGSFVVGAFIGGLFTHYVFDAPVDVDPAVDTEELQKALAKAERDKVWYALRSVNNIATGVMPQDKEMIFFTQNYWDQAMEYQVYESWSKDTIGQFDDQCRTLLAGTGLLAAENMYLYTWASTLDREFNNILAQSIRWDGAENRPYTNRLSIDFIWDGGHLSATNGSEEGAIKTDFTQQITTDDDTYVYIDVVEEAVDFQKEQSGLLYLYDTSTSKTIQNLDTGSNYTLNPGENDVSTLPAGIYKLPRGASYAGPMISVIGDHSADVNGALVLKRGDTIYVVTSESNTHYSIRSSSGHYWSTDRLYIQIDNGIVAETVRLLDSGEMRTVGYYDDLVQEFNAIAKNTYDTGLATWSIFDTVQESSPYVHPSSLPVNIKGQNLSMVEKYYMGINMMAQIKEYYMAHEGDLKDLEFTFTKENQDLYCYGDLYLNGKLWIENVVFTPYITTTNQHLELGMNTWAGTGFMAVWDVVEDYSLWDGTTAASSPMSPLDSNYQMDIKKIVSHGREVDSIDLIRATITPGGEGDHDPMPEPAPMPKVYDSAVLWVAILVELGVILLLLARITGLELLALCGIIVIVVGVVFPEAVSSLVLGTFDWSDLSPLSWL